jgi:DNA-binding protein YbaB
MDNMDNILNQITIIKKRLNQLENELSDITLRADDDNSIVSVVVNGKGNIIDYYLHDDEIKEETKDALIKATNRGLQKAKETRADKKQEIVGDVDIPDIPGLF